ncbi:MAG: RNA methyltransferase [Peptococcaceae bacterium]|nr:RNA methyltransferase [Peptococcaceae bacterium]
MLTSVHNPLVKQLVSLQSRKGRDNSGEFLVEGRRSVEEILLRDAPVKQVFLCPDLAPTAYQDWCRTECLRRGITYHEINERVSAKISGTEQPQGVFAVLAQPSKDWLDFHLDRQTVILCVAGIQDPGNLGTILRTALAAGVTQIVLTTGTVDLYNPKVVRSTLGTMLSQVILVDVPAQDVLAFCRAQALPLIVADSRGESYAVAPHLQPPLVLVVGNEGNGVSPCLLQGAVALVQIPMRYQVESLNVSIATGILLFEIVRRQQSL